MAKQLFANNVSTQIMEFLSASDVTITVSSTSRFPAISGGDWIMATIVPIGGQGTPEVVKITAISGSNLTVVRGQEGTTAQSFTYGALLELRVTKGSLEWLRDQATIFVDAITTVDSTSMVDGTVLYAKGRSTVGDGGGGVFRYVAGSTETADGGTVFAPTAGSGRFFRDGRTSSAFVGPLQAEWFGVSPTPGFDNGPALRSLRAAAETLGSTNAAVPVQIGQGTFEVTTAEADGTAGVRFNKACSFIGQGFFETIFEWKTATANQPLFLAQPTVATPLPIWRTRFEEFSVWAALGAAKGSAIKISPASPSASLGFRVAGVRVKGCQDGIAIVGSGGVTVYGGVVEDCTVEDIYNTGRGFYFASASYCEIRNCEAYPVFPVGAPPGNGETAYCYYFGGAWSKVKNCRAAGPVYCDAPSSELDFVIEGQGSTCAHNSNAVILVNRAASVRASILGGRITGQTNPTKALQLQDTNTVIEFLEVTDISGYSSPKTPLQLAAGNFSLLMAKASGTGVLKPEDDIDTGLDPTFGGSLRIINGGTYTNYGKWTFTYDPPSIAAGANVTTSVSCGGVSVGTPVVASFSNASADIEITATVTSLGNVQVRFTNRGSGAVDLASGTISVRVVNKL